MRGAIVVRGAIVMRNNYSFLSWDLSHEDESTYLHYTGYWDQYMPCILSRLVKMSASSEKCCCTIVT